jgi:hypothetical protein
MQALVFFCDPDLLLPQLQPFVARVTANRKEMAVLRHSIDSEFRSIGSET